MTEPVRCLSVSLVEYQNRVRLIIDKFGTTCPICGLYITHCRLTPDSECSDPTFKDRLSQLYKELRRVTDGRVTDDRSGHRD